MICRCTRIDFEKLSGSGNDFLCIDNRDGRFDRLLGDQGAGHMAKALCRRGLGVGADGLIFAITPELEGVAHIGARFFEPDGSEAELCGNGTACFLYWVIAHGWVPEGEVKVLTPAGVVRGHNGLNNYVRVCIPDPEGMQTDLQVTVQEVTWQCDFVVTGVPHLITYVDDLDRLDVACWGPRLRHHPRFGPRGVNANFVQVLGEGRLAVRTFEFGVEAETLACGTGSAAAAIMAARRFHWHQDYTTGRRPVHIRARSGDLLKVWFTASGGLVTDVCLETIVRVVCAGVVSPELTAIALNPCPDQAVCQRP